VECLQVECRYGASSLIVSCHVVVLVVLTAFMPFSVEFGEYPNACPKLFDTLVDVL